MLKSISTQIKKVFCRSDVKTSIAVFALIPVAIAFLISIESGIIQIGDSVFSAMGYASVIIGLLKSLFLIGGIIALISTAVISKEIDSGLDCSYFTRMKKQEYLYVCQNISMLCFVTLIFAFLLISSIVGWGIFLKDTEFGNSVFLSSDKDEAILLIFSILSAYLEMIMMSELFCFVSLLFKYSKAIIANLVIIVAIKLLSNIEALQRWVPSYIGDGTGLFEYSGNELISRGFEGISVLLVYTILFAIIGLITYRKMDLVR